MLLVLWPVGRLLRWRQGNRNGSRDTIRDSMKIVAALCACSFTLLGLTRPPDIPFQKHAIDLGSAEAVTVADINGDGKLDIVCGEYWYEAPSWNKHHFRDILYTNNYIDDLSTLPLDVDGDGRVVSGDFRDGSARKLPGGKIPARRTLSGTNTPSKRASPLSSPFWWTLIMTEEQTRFCRNSAMKKAPLAWDRTRRQGRNREACGQPAQLWPRNWRRRCERRWPKRYPDPSGWLEARPTREARTGNFILIGKIEGSLGFIYVRDVNGDERGDIVTSMAHDYGILGWPARLTANG